MVLLPLSYAYDLLRSGGRRLISHISTENLQRVWAARVSAKFEEGDFKGAVRLASSDDKLAPMNETTFEAL